MLTLEHVTKTYKDKTALYDVSLSFPDKGLVIVCGESGCGKTTLLNLASGADIPDNGKIFWRGCQLSHDNADDFRRAAVSEIFQDFLLADELSAGENIRLAAEACGKRISDEDISSLLSRVGLGDEIFAKRVSFLSGGEKQRVAVARALVKDNAVIFADEPTGNLDRKNGELVMSLLRDIAQDRLVIVVSHNERLNRQFGQYSVTLEDGCVVSSDLPDNKDADIPVQEFVAPKPVLSCKTALRLSLAGYEKNKLKCVFAAIAFVFVFALSAVANTLFIADVPFALASSVNSAEGKNLLVLLHSNDEGDPSSLFGLRDDVTAVYKFGLDENDVAVDDLPVSLTYAIVYSPSVGADVDTVCGAFPSSADEVMLPVIFARALLESPQYKDCASLDDLIGRRLAQDVGGNTTVSEVPVYIEFTISGVFSPHMAYDDIAVLAQNASSDLASKDTCSEVINSDFLQKSVFVGQGYAERIDLYDNDTSYSVVVDGTFVDIVSGYDQYSSYAEQATRPSNNEVIVGDLAAQSLGIAVGDTIELKYGSEYFEHDGLVPVRKLNEKGALSLTVSSIVTDDSMNIRNAIIVSPDIWKGTLLLSQTSLSGYFFDLSDEIAVYPALLSIQKDLESVYVSSATDDVTTGYLYGRAFAENTVVLHGFYGRVFEGRFIGLLPASLALTVCLVCLGVAFFGFLLSSKDKLYNVLRTLGFAKKQLTVLMLVQLIPLFVAVAVLGLCFGAATAFAINALFADTVIISESVLPLGWHAALIATLMTAISAVVSACAKTAKLLSRTVAQNKNN